MAPDVALLMKLGESGPDYSDLPPVEARATTERDLILFASRIAPCAVEEEIAIGDGLLATRYSNGTPERGLVLFFHGGGFVIGSRASRRWSEAGRRLRKTSRARCRRCAAVKCCVLVVGVVMTRPRR
jgi:acetyl esterase/lipase